MTEVTCSWCHGPLPARRRRFCSDDHRRRGQKAERKYDPTEHDLHVRGLVRAQGKRAGADLDMFRLFSESVDYARARLADAAERLIAQGYSYGDIGRALGITRQSAWERFGRQGNPDTPNAGTGGPA
jgi:hypothetical protein